MDSTGPVVRGLRRSPKKTALVAWLGVLAPLFLLMAGLLLSVVYAAPLAPAACVPGPHSGPITASEEWCLADSPHLVSADVTVQNGAVLTIEPGVVVQFAAGTGLSISNGQLVADGLGIQPITFTADVGSPPRGYWTGISFESLSQPNILRLVWISYAGTALSIDDSDGHVIDDCYFFENGDGGDLTSGGALNATGDGLIITDSTFQDNELGLRLQKSFDNVITGNILSNNDDFGIGFFAVGGPAGGDNRIADNQIQQNGGFGIAFIPGGIYGGGSNNQITGNEIGENGGDGVYLDDGTNNQVLDNEIVGNGGDGVIARDQAFFQLVGNVVRGNDQNGLTYETPNTAPAALHSNVLCNNVQFDIESFWATLPAEGNWFGTNTPASGIEVSGTVDFTPWISMSVAAAPTALPADGSSTAVVTVTMSGAGRTVPDGYELYISPFGPGSVSPGSLFMAGGQATTTYTAGAIPGPVGFTVQDICDSLLFPDVLTLQAVDLAVFKAGPGGTVMPGELVTYTIRFSETNGLDATGFYLDDTLPTGATWFSDTSGDCGLARQVLGSSVRWTAGLWPGGATCAFSLTVLVGDDACQSQRLVNLVSVGSDVTDSDLGNNSWTTLDDSPALACLDLAVVKTDGGLIIKPNKDYAIEYTITVSNVGVLTATSVVVTDVLPVGGSYSGSDWACAGGLCSQAIGVLSPTLSVALTLPVELDKSALDCPIVLTNTVRVADAVQVGDINPTDNVFTLTSVFDCLPDLVVVKNDNVGPVPDQAAAWVFDLLDLRPQEPSQQTCVSPGERITYTVAYVNTGLVTASQVALTETLPNHTSFVGHGWTCLGSSCTRSAGDLAPGAGGVAHFTVLVDSVPPDLSVENEVRIGGLEDDLYPPDNVSYDDTPICGSAPPAYLYLPLVAKQYSGGPPPPPPPPPPGAAYVSDVAVNEVTDRVYVASPYLDAVFAVDPSGPGSIVATIPVGDHPLGLAVVTTTNKIYSANLDSWTLTAIRGSDHTRITDIYVGAQACKAAADSADARVYVTNHLESDNGAAAVNSQTDEFLYYYSRLHATQGRYGIAVDRARDKLFIAARDAGLIAIQDAFYPDQEPFLVKLDPLRVPYVVAFNPATQHLFVTAADDNLVVVLDPYSIAWDKGRWTLYKGRWAFVLDRANAGWIKEIGVGSGAEEGIAVNPLTGYVYVTNADSDTVSILRDDADPANIQWVKDVAVGEHPQGVAVDVLTNQIYVGNSWSRDLSVLDGTTNTVVKTIPLD